MSVAGITENREVGFCWARPECKRRAERGKVLLGELRPSTPENRPSYKTTAMRPILMKGHERPLTFLKYNRDGDLLFSCAKDHNPTVWFADNGERLGTYRGHNGAVWSCDISSNIYFLFLSILPSGCDYLCVISSEFRSSLRLYVLFCFLLYALMSYLGLFKYELIVVLI